MHEAARKRLPFAVEAAVIAALVLLAGAIRFRLLDVPLERDEGEYAYAGRLILEGIPPYVEFYNMKLPGIYGAYAVILALFGETARGIHAGLLVVNAGTTLLVFLLARRFLGGSAPLFAAACFALLSVGRSVQGVFANSEHFVVLFATAGLLVLHRGLEKRSGLSMAAAGALFATGMLMKQHGAAFLLLGLAWIAVRTLRDPAGGPPVPSPVGALVRRASLFGAGAIVVYSATCLVFLLAGAFDNFWHWTVEYAFAYISQTPPHRIVPNFVASFSGIVGDAPLVWALAGGGLAALLGRRRSGRDASLLLLFALLSLAAVAPGSYFRPHYFVLLLPSSAILAGAGFETVGGLLPGRVSGSRRGFALLLLAVLAIGTALVLQRAFLFRMTPEQACRSTYGLNPFVESPRIARYIRERTDPGDTIAVIGSEPQIYFYADRRAATGYVYTYALMEEHRFALAMQQEMIDEIEAARPKYMVYVRNVHSWGYRDDSETKLLDWFGKYRSRHYELAAMVNMFPTGTEYHWEPPIPWPPRSDFWIAILKRKA